MSQKIHSAILAIQRDIHAVGIDKTRRNQEQKFNFRGIDDALLAFAPLLTHHSVILSPRYDGITVAKRATKSGGSTYNVKLHGTFTFTHAEDGSTHTVGPVYGEANDGQDKAVSKAESIALRQMFFIAFCVPHEPVIGGDPDACGEAGEIERVSDEQAASIKDMLEATGSDTARFLEWLKVPTVADIPAAAFDTAMKALRQKEAAANG